jgi:hypothetical protein
MEAETILKNGASVKCRTRRTGFFSGALLVALFLLQGCSGFVPIDIDGQNVEELVLLEVNKQLDRAVKGVVITHYEQSSIYTPTESFEATLQKYADKGATLHPGLTYHVSYPAGMFSTAYAQCSAMAYSIIKDGKLCGCGVVFSNALEYAWKKTWIVGNHSIYQRIYMRIAFLVVLMFVVIPWIFKFLKPLIYVFGGGGSVYQGGFGRDAFLEDMARAQNGDVHAMVNVGLAYWRGDGVGRDLSQTEYWLTRAHTLGDPHAWLMLQRILANPGKLF